jgi:hypothetical protein
MGLAGRRRMARQVRRRARPLACEVRRHPSWDMTIAGLLCAALGRHHPRLCRLHLLLPHPPGGRQPLLELKQQIARRTAQRRGEGEQHTQGRLVLTQLQHADVVTADVGLEGELFLRQARLQAALTQYRSEGFDCFQIPLPVKWEHCGFIGIICLPSTLGIRCRLQCGSARLAWVFGRFASAACEPRRSPQKSAHPLAPNTPSVCCDSWRILTGLRRGPAVHGALAWTQWAWSDGTWPRDWNYLKENAC